MVREGRTLAVRKYGILGTNQWEVEHAGHNTLAGCVTDLVTMVTLLTLKRSRYSIWLRLYSLLHYLKDAEGAKCKSWNKQNINLRSSSAMSRIKIKPETRSVLITPVIHKTFIFWSAQMHMWPWPGSIYWTVVQSNITHMNCDAVVHPIKAHFSF